MAETLAAIANNAAIAESNELSQTNAGSIGPAVAVAWTSSSFTPKETGKLLITATITGNDATVSEAVDYELLKNPTAATGASFAALGGTAIGPVGMITDAGLHGDFANTISWIDTAVVGTAVTYGIAAQSSASHNLTVPIGGAAITIVELG
jgi:hypothetical protein